MFNAISEVLQSITILDLTDIILISVFIYFILIWFKKAKARFMFVGIVVIGLVYLLARSFKLYMTTMILQAFFAIFLFIIVVIFQDDFRHFFENIAVRGLLRRRRRGSSFEKNIEVLSSTVTKLARRKIGALIVLRAADVLERHIEAGYPSDALLNPLILEAIFSPQSPTHDGAVIIEQDRISRFGCYLPLSTNLSMLGRLGTRHAAALGLAERTDALCIVVSEEYGTISVAESGVIRQLEGADGIGRALEKFYSVRFPSKKKDLVWDFLTGHSLEKILAVVIACVMWFTFGHRVETVRRDIVVPIEYRNLSADKIIAEPKQKEVVVTFSGIERAFNLFDPKEMKLPIDMSEAKDGENSILVTKSMINAPSGLSVINAEPDMIKLTVHRMVNTSAIVKVQTRNRPAAGVVIKDIKVEPERIQVVVSSIVPKERIIVSTEEIDLKSVTDTSIFTPNLIIPSEIKIYGEKIPEVKVIVEVEKKEKS